MPEPFDSIRAGIASLYPDNTVQQITPFDARAALELVVECVEQKSMLASNTRAELVGRLAYWTPDDGTVIFADGLCYKYVNSGVTTIPDLPGCIPWNHLTPFHWQDCLVEWSFGVDPVDVTDMGGAINSAWTYASSKSVAFNKPLQVAYDYLTGPRSTVQIDFMNRVCGTTITVGPNNKPGVSLINGAIVALPGTLTSADYVVRFKGTSGNNYIKSSGMTHFHVFGNDVCGGILFERVETGCFLEHVHVNGLADNSIGIATRNKATDLVFDNVYVGQYEWAEFGREVQDNRNAKGISIGTADFKFSNIIVYYSLGIEKIGEGPGQINGLHIYNGAVTTPSSPAQNIYGLDLQEPNGMVVQNYYVGKSTIRINCDLLTSGTDEGDLTGGNKRCILDNLSFHRSGGDYIQSMIELTTSVAGNDLGGLRLGLLTVSDSAINNIRLSSYGAGSFTSGEFKWTVLCMTDALGEPLSFDYYHDDVVYTPSVPRAMDIANWAGNLLFNSEGFLKSGRFKDFGISGKRKVVLISDDDNSGNGGVEFWAGTTKLGEMTKTGQLQAGSLSFDAGSTSFEAHGLLAAHAFSDASGHFSPTTGQMQWQRIGRMMTITYSVLNLSTAGMTGSDELRLPLPAQATGPAVGAILHHTVNYNDTMKNLAVYVASGDTHATLVSVGDAVGTSTLLVSGITSGTSDIFALTLTYPVGAW